MITKFIDRNDELGFLKRKYEEESAQLVIIYGRRRVGKTELTKEFFKGEYPGEFVGEAYRLPCLRSFRAGHGSKMGLKEV